jgi:hypothetical protein
MPLNKILQSILSSYDTIRTRALAISSTLLLWSSGLAKKHCRANDECWPPLETWSSLNSSVSCRLVSPLPPAWPCLDPGYDEAACNIVKSNWDNPIWRSNQTGASQDPLWDSLDCGIDTPQNATCGRGAVPVYAVAAQNGNL